MPMDSTVVITGGADGIGRALAVEAAKRGMSVAVIDRDPAEDTVAAVRAAGGHASSYVADVTDSEGFAAVTAMIRAEFDTITAVIANVGFGVPGGLMDVSDEDVSRVMDVNVIGTLRTVRTFLPDLRASSDAGEETHLVITGSEHSLGVPRDQVAGPYTVAKHALLGVADVLRCQLEQTSISVSLLAPGWTTTPTIVKYMDHDPGLAATVNAVAQSPDDVAKLCWDGIKAGLFIVPTNTHSHPLGTIRAEHVERGFAALDATS